MKKIFLSFFFLAIQSAIAQNAIADLKFEEAEMAFNNQDYETTIKKLDEFDEVFGSVTSKSLYLRIISEDKIFENLSFGGSLGFVIGYVEPPAKGVVLLYRENTESQNLLNSKDNVYAINDIKINTTVEFQQFMDNSNAGDKVTVHFIRNQEDKRVEIIISRGKVGSDFILYQKNDSYKYLVSLRKNVKNYLKAMNSENLDDKYREVSSISKKIEKYPNTKEAWDSQKISYQKYKTEFNAQLIKDELKKYEEKDLYNKSIAPYIDAYGYEDIETGIDFEIVKKTKGNKFYKEKMGNKYISSNNGFDIEVDENNKVCSYDLKLLESNESLVMAEKDKYIIELNSFFGQKITPLELSGPYSKFYVIRSPYAKNILVLQAMLNGNNSILIFKKLNNKSESFQLYNQ